MVPEDFGLVPQPCCNPNPNILVLALGAAERHHNVLPTFRHLHISSESFLELPLLCPQISEPGMYGLPILCQHTILS